MRVAVVVNSGAGSVRDGGLDPVYLDGEVMVLETPLLYRTRVHGLRVILPS